ncbi:hypothetical protein CC1G_07182 [Coprinopsis cinerea okayama7|uniref:F-box domain-containing protein n=1 Tax=Coprinopsis cinerea (strain Okayama-7 / 130 / ATCC MYA-4618 / FGSC 9003) TaxID=240176 RepID=A8NRD3_COPC7|nr:hypothetical protein CC1G_07182 [Coprinopsis cinerea okayama7\|eukprot:XP_001835758.2 hypothetical protein CC1G_07182 [Coprinopsis cinerea okayama7\
MATSACSPGPAYWPPEIIEEIARHIDDSETSSSTSTLCQCTLVSRHFRSIFQPLAFERVGMHDLDTADIEYNSSSGRNYNRTLASFARLLGLRPDIATFVRGLHLQIGFVCTYLSPREHMPAKNTLQYGPRILEGLDRLDEFSLESLPRARDTDFFDAITETLRSGFEATLRLPTLHTLNVYNFLHLPASIVLSPTSAVRSLKLVKSSLAPSGEDVHSASHLSTLELVEVDMGPQQSLVSTISAHPNAFRALRHLKATNSSIFAVEKIASSAGESLQDLNVSGRYHSESTIYGSVPHSFDAIDLTGNPRIKSLSLSYTSGVRPRTLKEVLLCSTCPTLRTLFRSDLERFTLKFNVLRKEGVVEILSIDAWAHLDSVFSDGHFPRLRVVKICIGDVFPQSLSKDSVNNIAERLEEARTNLLPSVAALSSVNFDLLSNFTDTELSS